MLPAAKPNVFGDPDDYHTRTIYVIRHGQTALNAQHRLRGWENPPLNDQGHDDAQAVAAMLSGIELDALYVSDLERAQQTAEPILQGRSIKPVVTELLRPIDFGIWCGQLMSKVEKPMVELQRRWELDPEIKAPGGGESWRDFQDRQLEIWASMIGSGARTLAMVAHLRNAVWCLGYAINGTIPLAGVELRMLERLTQESGKLTVLTYSRREGLKVSAVNVMGA